MYKIGLLIISALITIPIKHNYGQSTQHGVLIIPENRVDSLHSLYVSLPKKKSVSGFRIQLYSGSTRMKAMEARASFMEKYPEIHSFVVYQAPNFKVRAGSYRKKHEAYRAFKIIEKDFPSSYIVNDEIYPD